jgi:hypothetical protein
MLPLTISFTIPSFAFLSLLPLQLSIRLLLIRSFIQRLAFANLNIIRLLLITHMLTPLITRMPVTQDLFS